MMPIVVNWYDDEKSIVTAIGQGRWTWEDYHGSLNEVVDLAKSVSHRVDLIYMGAEGSQMPRSSGLPHYKRAINMMPPNTRMHVIVSNKMIAHSILNIFLKLYHLRNGTSFVLVSTIDDAINLIKQNRIRELRDSA